MASNGDQNEIGNYGGRMEGLDVSLKIYIGRNIESKAGDT